MTIAFNASASAESNTITLPSHRRGDLLFIFALRTDSAANVTMPSGWKYGGNNAGLNTDNLTIAYRIALGSDETAGTWTNANFIVAAVYRPTANWHTSLIRTASRSISSGSNIPNYPRSFQVNGNVVLPGADQMQDFESVVLLVAASASKAVSLNVATPSTTHRVTHEGATNNQLCLFDTGSPIASRINEIVTLSGATTWLTGTMVMVDTGIPIDGPAAGFTGIRGLSRRLG